MVQNPSGLLTLDETETARVDEQVKQGLDALRIRCCSACGRLDLVNGNAAPEGGEKGSEGAFVIGHGAEFLPCGEKP